MEKTIFKEGFMTKVTKEEGLKIAHISHIGLSDNELQPLIEQLEQVLSYAQRVAQIMVPTANDQSIKLINVMRDDIAIPFDAAVLLDCAPVREGNYFVVQAILDTK